MRVNTGQALSRTLKASHSLPMFVPMAGPVTHRRRASLAASLALALVAAFALPAAAGIVPNPANDPSLIGQPLEDYRYDDADRCLRQAQAGSARWHPGSTATCAASRGGSCAARS